MSGTYQENLPLIERVLASEPNSGEHTVEHPKLGRRVLHTTRVPHFSDGGEVLDYLAVIEDVTDRKTLEEQLRQKQKIEAVGQLAGGISHEVNNMLTPIVGLTEISLCKLPEKSDLRPNLEMVLQASNRVEEMVKRILAFSRADTEETIEFDVGTTVADTIPLLQATIPSTIQLEATLDESTGMVHGNPTAIQQILMNLVTNAAHAMEGESERLEIVLDRRVVDRAEAARNLDLRAGPYARLTVRDTGCGMDQEVVHRIFEPFFTTRDVGAGTGLGLSVVHGIVKKHQGAIEVESKAGEGTTVRVQIPLLEHATAAARQPAE